ncbi:MAG: sugar ABC transporter ATP-binding protein [Saprospiraceae bacterium]|nr:sugar ABC transporter ATP-binding protein [Saprospiraceae bacterium]
MVKSTLLNLRHITKTYPGVVALDRVSFDLLAGEVHALCGENGAGKSTLMNVLSGNQQPDRGEIILGGEAVVLPNQKKAQEAGIGIVYQEKSLVSELSVADNVFAGIQPCNTWGFIDRQALFAKTQDLLERLRLTTIHPQQLVSTLSPGKQQMVEIAKALAQEPNILILDEPTAALSDDDTSVVFDIVRDLKAKGVGIIYISHRMHEIFKIGDRVTVLKDGKFQGLHNTQDTNVDEIIRLMVGRDLQDLNYQDHFQSDVVLQVKDLDGEGFSDISFSLHRGEILGLAGLVGAGRTELARAIFGIDKNKTGTIKINDESVRIRHPQDAIQFGLGYLPEHRKEQGLFLDMSVVENVVSTNLDVGDSGKIWMDTAEMRRVADHFVEKLDIRTPSINQKVVYLSGGNQQKIVLGKWLLRKPDILIVDEPTHGIDVGAKSEIYRLFNELSASGTAILMISSELTELIGLCDRILVMSHGELMASIDRPDFSEEEIIQYSSGLKRMP